MHLPVSRRIYSELCTDISPPGHLPPYENWHERTKAPQTNDRDGHLTPPKSFQSFLNFNCVSVSSHMDHFDICRGANVHLDTSLGGFCPLMPIFIGGGGGEWGGGYRADRLAVKRD